MKKLLCVLLIACLLAVSAASADSVDSFVIYWNAYADDYGAPQISKSMFSEKEGMHIFAGDGFTMILLPDGSGYKNASIVSEDADILLPAAAVLGMCLVDSFTADDLIGFMGYTSYFYTQARAGKKSIQYIFGGYMYGVQASSGGYMFSMVRM